MIYCTLASEKYLLQGLTMYSSLRKFTKDKLYWLCLDDETYNIVSKYSDIEAVRLDDLNKKDIEKLKTNPICSYAKENPYAQFCWSLSAYFTWHLLKTHKEVAYVDSDIYFLQSPDLIVKECKGYGAGIHTHRFGVKHRHLFDDVGEFNVGVVYFSKKGMNIATQWKDWLLHTDHKYWEEYGRCGDQKYLNLFPKLFKKQVRIFDDKIGYAGPWNYGVQQFDGDNIIFKGKTTPLVFIHFARFKADFINDDWGCGYLGDEFRKAPFDENAQIHKIYDQYFKEMKEQREIMFKKTTKPTAKVKLCFAMIVWNSDYVLKQTLDSIYPYASQIVINHAPVENFTSKPDNTGKILAKYPDPDKKITVINEPGGEKTDLCKSYMPLINKDIDYLWTIDADEIFKPEAIERTVTVLKERKPHVVCFIMKTLVGGLDYYLTGFERNYNVRRIFKYEPGCKYIDHRPPRLSTENVKDPVIIMGKEMFEKYGVEFYHYSYVFPKQVYEKVQYYEKAVIQKGNCIPNFFYNVWLPWAMNRNRKAIEEKYKGIHEFEPRIRGECLPKKFTDTHPEGIIKVKDQILKRIDKELKYYSSLIDTTTCWYNKDCADKMNEAHDKYLKEKSEAHHFTILTQLLPFLDERGGKVIELGCGCAHMSTYCDDFIYTGADLPHIIDNCSKRNYPKAKYYYCDVIEHDIRFINYYDIVITGALIDVMQHPLEILTKILKHTKKYFILHRQEITEKGITEVIKNDSYGSQTFHSILSRDDFNTTIKKAGFEVLKELSLNYQWENGGSSFLLKHG